MPRIFRPRDIEKMTESDVSQEFVDYFNRLSESRQSEFAENRPDLYSAVLAWKNPAEDELIEETTNETSVDSQSDGTGDTEISSASAVEDEEWQAVQLNEYENVNLPRMIQSGLKSITALTVNDPERCPAHRIYLKKYTPKFYKPSGAVMGINLYYCDECNRLFIDRAEFENSEKNLSEWGVPHTFYDFDVSKRYLRTQMKPYELDTHETIYWVDPWIEDNPVCPVHECSLEEIPCVVKYRNKTESFDAYYCEDCKKVIMRKTKAIFLEDRFAQIGIPSDRFEQLVRKEPAKTAVPRRTVTPDYLLNEGRRAKYTFDRIDNFYYLTEEDTAVVSDSCYCPLDGHDTETVLGLIWVNEKISRRRRSYLVMLGYCAECNKFYMDQTDYETIYRNGRPEVRIIVNLDDQSYMISSGEVFNIERVNLEVMEKKIDHEIKKIHEKPDYVSQYETVSYNDDGDLLVRKSRSKRKYEPRLEELAGYIPQPYEYFVEITSDGKKEKYYIGNTEITLGGRQEVIAVSSRLGRSLVNYRTIKVNKDGEEYRISLSRQFDISDASLYGYTNLRTDEDIVFRQGITDPFLVRVLNMRRRQHDLIDIFVTIQENQNTIVDADFNDNLIVQGCAGSGKTMVLLHRLSALKYAENDFDFSDDALILTPNDHFTLHINGLASSLQIDSIRRISVERYYADILGLYSDELRPSGQITSEMNVPQSFVNFIYSDDFMRNFQRNYNEVMEERNQLIPLVHKAAEALNADIKDIDISDDSDVVPQLEKAMSIISARININENAFKQASDDLQNAKDRKEKLADNIRKTGVQASKELRQAGQSARTIVLEELADRKKTIDRQKTRLSRLESEKRKLAGRTESVLENTVMPFDEYISDNQDLINEPVSQLINTIHDQRTELAAKEEEKNRIEALLNIPFEEVITLSGVNDPEITVQLTELSAARDNLELLQKERSRIENRWMFGKARRLAANAERITEAENTIDTCKTEINELLTNRRSELEATIKLTEQLRTEIINASEEVKEMIAGNFSSRLDNLNDQISASSQWIKENSAALGEYLDLTNQLRDEMKDSEIAAWFNSISVIVPEVRDTLGTYRRIMAENKRYRTQYGEIDTIIEDAQTYYDQRLADRYPDEIKNEVIVLREKTARYSAVNTSQMIFDRTVKPFMKSHKISSVNGRNHRYDLYARLLFALRYYGKAVGNMKYICIDEGQDLAVNEYRLIRELNGNDVIFNIYGDTNQLIHPGRGITDWDKLRKLFDFKQYSLNENYRNTNQITRFCNDSFNMSMLQTGVDGPKVREITKDEFEEELSDLQIGKERVAVLLPRGIQKKTYIDQSLLGSEVRKAIGEEIDNEKIAVMYVDEVKGIEFDKVYVDTRNMGRNEKYIAYTRALNELIVVIDESVYLS